MTVTSSDQVLGHVASGSATLSTSGSTLTVNQTTSSAILDWLRFSIASGETVNFVQPAITSIALNRVIGNEQSLINGTLRRTAGSSWSTLTASSSERDLASTSGALVASALNISDSNFLANNYVFTRRQRKRPGDHNGNIIAADGGFIILVSNDGVTNSGTLSAPDGKVLLCPRTT